MRNFIVWLFFSFFLTSVLCCTFAQGNNNTPNSNALIDFNTNNKGMVLPKVGLAAYNSPAPLANHTPGMMVYNTGVQGNDVVEDVYVNTGTKWIGVGNRNNTGIIRWIGMIDMDELCAGNIKEITADSYMATADDYMLVFIDYRQPEVITKKLTLPPAAANKGKTYVILSKGAPLYSPDIRTNIDIGFPAWAINKFVIEKNTTAVIESTGSIWICTDWKSSTFNLP